MRRLVKLTIYWQIISLIKNCTNQLQTLRLVKFKPAATFETSCKTKQLQNLKKAANQLQICARNFDFYTEIKFDFNGNLG